MVFGRHQSLTKMKGYFIDPASKLVSIVEFNDDSIASIIDCSTIALGATFKNGDVIYTDDNAHSKALMNVSPLTMGYGFHVQDFGFLHGKGLLTGSDSSGESRSPIISLEDFIAKVSFEQDPFIVWYENFLSRAGISSESNVKVQYPNGVKWIPISYILNVISLLPTSKKNEIKMMAEIDISKGLDPLDLLKHFASHLGD